MANPSPKTFTMPSGRPFYGGQYPAPSWADGIATRTWKEIPNSSFLSKAASIITPPNGYLGNSPIVSIMDAFNDPIAKSDNSKLYLYGGGHRDGTCDVVVELDTNSLTYSQKVTPTPPSCYPPGFQANGEVIYPSGIMVGPYPGIFSSKLTDPRDTPYNAPKDSPGVSHQYQANSIRGDTVHFFYGKYKELNLATGLWNLETGVDVGALLNAFDSKYKPDDLQQGTSVVYDEVTDKFLVSMVPGDAGISWRVGFFLFDPVTKTISNVSGVWAKSSMVLNKIGRYAYATCILQGNPMDTVKGWRFNFDTKVVEYFDTVGDVIPTVSGGSTIETVPANYHAGRNSIIRWNYGGEVASLYELSLTPIGGTGTYADPLRLPQTKLTIAGTPPSSVILNYRRIYYNQQSDCLLFLPSAASNIYAVKL